MILCYHSTAIDAIPPPYLSLKQCFRRRNVNQRYSLGVWFHVIINLQPLIPEKGNVFFPIEGVENASLNRVPWGRCWGGQILYIWCRRGRLFVKDAFRFPLFLDDCKYFGTMEGLPGNVYGR